MANFINIIASVPFSDASGTPLRKGLLRVTPSSPFLVGGGGQALPDCVVRRIVNGVFTAPLQLANPANTSPQGIGYTFTVVDLNSGETSTFTNVLIAGDTNDNFDLATLNTGQFVTAVPQTTVSADPRGAAATAQANAEAYAYQQAATVQASCDPIGSAVLAQAAGETFATAQAAAAQAAAIAAIPTTTFAQVLLTDSATGAVYALSITDGKLLTAPYISQN